MTTPVRAGQGRLAACGAGGAALLLCLLLLGALTMLGIAAASDAALQQRMAGNLEATMQAARNADAALGWAEDWLFSLDGARRPEACTVRCGPAGVIRAAGVYPPGPEYLGPGWWRDNAYPAGFDPLSGAVLDAAAAAGAGYWIAEEVHFEGAPERMPGEPELAYYRLTARGAGAMDRGVTVIESIVARPWGSSDWTDALPAIGGAPGLCRRLALPPPCGRLAWRRRR